MGVLIGKKESVLSAIEELLNGNIVKTSAICENIDILTKQEFFGYRIVRKFSQSWRMFSGDECFPISGVDSWITCFENNLLWEGEQRILRMSLLEHLKSEVLKLSNEEVEEMFV